MSGFLYIWAYYLLIDNPGIPEVAPFSGKSVDERGDPAIFSFELQYNPIIVANLNDRAD